MNAADTLTIHPTWIRFLAGISRPCPYIYSINSNAPSVIQRCYASLGLCNAISHQRKPVRTAGLQRDCRGSSCNFCTNLSTHSECAFLGAETHHYGTFRGERFSRGMCALHVTISGHAQIDSICHSMVVEGTAAIPLRPYQCNGIALVEVLRRRFPDTIGDDLPLRIYILFIRTSIFRLPETATSFSTSSLVTLVS